MHSIIQKITLLFIINCAISNALNLCTYAAYSRYTEMSKQYPEMKTEFDILSRIPLPIWYTDRNIESLNIIKDNINQCNNLLSIIIIYGLPNKDCNAKESQDGNNKNENDYKIFLNNLYNIIQQKEIILILEPDAINFLLPGNCGINYNYKENLKTAIQILSQNNNAKLYLDIGYWNVIYSEDRIISLINIINEIDPNNKLIGFSLNLSNYRKNEELINGCQRLNTFSKKNYHCIIDTSRNYNGPSSDNQWCNLISAGIGQIPTKKTYVDFIDYFLWLKPQIELDGHCYGLSNSYQTNKNAGDIDIEYFKLLWNQGIFKKELNYC